MTPAERMAGQIGFILEIDKLKHVLRQSLLIGTDRQENDAEHSWHLAIMAVVLAEHANEPIDIGRVLKMLLVHDIVEIDAGDTFAYDAKGNESKAERERVAADRIFGLLPEDQEAELRALWEEFEARETPEARFAIAMDSLEPLLLNYYNQGRTWQKHGIHFGQVVARVGRMAEGSQPLWEHVHELLQDAVKQGYLRPEEPQR